MRQAIRALGWVTKILWIILIATIITVAYSATQISVSLGESQTTATEQAITISFPINITNKGLYDLTQLNVTTRITDENSQTLANGTTIDQLVQKGTSTTRTHNITINIPEILAQNSSLLFKDTTFTVFQYVSLTYANAIPISLHANYTMQWGAPLSNLTVGKLSVEKHYNVTYSIATVQLHFENHNQYLPVNGTMRIEIYNSRQTLRGTGTANIDVQPNTSYDTQVNVLVRNSRQTTTSGQIHLSFETPTFNYGPVVTSFG